MDDQKVHQARQFLSDYVASNHQKIENWFSGVSREDLGAELILLCLKPRKIGVAYDLTGIALGFAMRLFEKIDGGHLAAQKVVEHNLERGTDIPPEVLNFLENPPQKGKQIGRSAKYARRDLLVLVLLKYLTVAFGLPKYSSVKKPKKSKGAHKKNWQRFTDQLSFGTFMSLFGRWWIFEGDVLGASAKHAVQKACQALRDLPA